MYDPANRSVKHSENSLSIQPWFSAFNVIWLVICFINFGYIISRVFYEGLVTFFADPAEVGDLLLIVLGFVVAFLNIHLSYSELPK